MSYKAPEEQNYGRYGNKAPEERYYGRYENCYFIKKAQYGRNYGRYGNKAPEERNYGSIGIVILSNKPSMGEIMVDKKSVPQKVKRLSI